MSLIDASPVPSRCVENEIASEALPRCRPSIANPPGVEPVDCLRRFETHRPLQHSFVEHLALAPRLAESSK